MKKLFAIVLASLCLSYPIRAYAQTEGDDPDPAAKKADTGTGIALPNSDRLRVRIRSLVGYGIDESQSSLGYPNQGRVGYLIVELFGKLDQHFSYRFEVNPITENQPGVSCGEKNYYYPNTAGSIGPTMACDNNGRQRVDDYRSVALDPLMQQGAIRQAYINYTLGPMDARFGRFILPIGFGWEEMGSMTAKDATHIQRINAEASFGFLLQFSKQYKGRRLASVCLAGITGDGNKFHDYDYFYGIDGSLDSNTWPTLVLCGAVSPIAGLEVKASLKKGDSGSKVERLPNFFASKRNDDALILSGKYSPRHNITVFGEQARYTWGLTKTSAELLGMTDTDPVQKTGYYIGGDLNLPVTRGIRAGTTVTREELSRDDALTRYMAEQGLYQVTLGKKERSTVYRAYMEVNRMLTIGVYMNHLSNPFPWLSGIEPIEGIGAYTGKGSNKWGVTARVVLQ